MGFAALYQSCASPGLRIVAGLDPAIYSRTEKQDPPVKRAGCIQTFIKTQTNRGGDK
jgi:hypothetical protein